MNRREMLMATGTLDLAIMTFVVLAIVSEASILWWSIATVLLVGGIVSVYSFVKNQMTIYTTEENEEEE